jgi:PAS domain S-box-containing protein
MTNKDSTDKANTISRGQTLRKEAETVVSDKLQRMSADLQEKSPEEERRLFHELQVHQIELEMQNEELRRIQTELDAERARYFDLYDLAPVGYCTISDKGLIEEANLAAASLFGVTRRSLAKQPLSKYIFQEDENIYVKLKRQLFATGEPQSCELRIVRQDKTSFWAHLASTVAIDHDGATVGRVVINDVPERQRAEDRLRQEQRFSKSILESLPGIFYLYTYPENRLVLWNKAHETLLGYEAGEMAGRHVTDWFAGEVKKGVLQAVDKVMEKGHNSIEAPLMAKDGNLLPFILTGGKFETEGRRYFMGIGVDISERRLAEEQLRENVARLKALLNATSDSVILIDPEGTILDLNENSAHRRDLNKGKMLGQNLFDFLPPEAAANRQKAVIQTLQEKRLIEYDENRGGKDYRIRLFPVVDEQGEVFQLASFSRDITERKQAEEEKTLLEAQFHQAQKMESVGQLAGGVAHDFNNMLGVILGHAELAQKKLDPADPVFSNLEEIHKAATRSAQITRQLLAFARKQTVVPRILDLNETVEGMLEMLRRLIGENINLSWMPENGLWPVQMDPSQIDQILANLCVNARHAIGGVGKITVLTGNSSLDEQYCDNHAGFVSGDYVRLVVTDDGCGMDRQTLAHIFEPFFTTKAIGEGTGLGLATVYGAVKQNNGFVYAESEPGQGAAFTIYLPRYQGAVGQAQTAEAMDVVLPGHESILLLEDEPAILEMTTTMLQLLGYTVLAAGTTEEALRLAVMHEGEIDLLLTDVIMPEMNGRDLAGRLLVGQPEMRVLFMSGYAANILTHQGVLDAGVNFLEKPFSMQELAAKVRQTLEGTVDEQQ